MIFRKIFKNTLFLSCVITLGFCLLSFLLSGFHIAYSTNDDYFISLMILSGEDKNIFLSYFLSAPLVWLQRIMPTLNLFIFFQIILCVVSLVTINYVLLSRFNKKTGAILASGFTLLYVATATVYLQWTQTSVLGAVAGLLLALYAVLYTKDKKMVFLVVLGGCLALVSSLYRITSFFVVCVIFFGYLFIKLVAEVAIIKKTDRSFKSSFSIVLHKYGKTILVLLLVLVVGIGLDYASKSIKSSSAEYTEFNEYNSVRSGSVDYYRPPYDENQEFYQSIGIHSQNDLDMLGTWHGDEDFFTTDRLSAISDYLKQPQFESVFSLNYIYRLLSNKINSLMSVKTELVLGFLIAISIAGLILLFIFRNKIKFLFPIFLSLLWVAFFYVFSISNRTFLALPIAVIVIISSFVFNRYNYIVNTFLTFVFMGLYTYLNFTRISFRTTYNIILPVFLLVVFNISKNEIRVKVKQVSGVKRTSLCIISAVLCSSIAIVSTVVVYVFEIQTHFQADDLSLINYTQQHENTVFVCELENYREAFYNYSEPLGAPKTNDNIIHFLGWMVGSPYYHRELQNHQITQLFDDMIDSGTIKLVLKQKNNEGRDLREMYELYYNEHYSNGSEILLKEEDRVGDNIIYSIVSSTK